MDKIRMNPNITANEMKQNFKSLYGFDVSYKKIWRGKEKALGNVVGDEDNSYNRCSVYLDKLKDDNPGSYVKMEVHEESNRFQRLFVCISGTIEGFKYCRPLLFLDGTFLKGIYKGAMLCATGKTGNDDFYPFAFCICSAENDDNWFWFLKHLAAILNPQNRDITFISDRHSGLVKGIPQYFPTGYHSFCRNHLVKNLRQTHFKNVSKEEREELIKKFQECFYAPTETLFDVLLSELKAIGGDKIECFFSEIPFENWTSAHFKGKRYREFDNNCAESFNMWIKSERAMPVYQLIDSLRKRLMNYNGEKMLESRKWTTVLCKRREDWLQHMCLKGSVYNTHVCDGIVYGVVSENYHTVDLENLTCTCQQWQQRGFLCSHACAAIYRHQGSVYDFVENYFTADCYRKAYETPIIPSTDIEEGLSLIQCETPIKPPATRRPPGRPPSKRAKSYLEKIRKPNKCGRCGEETHHNRRTCTAPITRG